MDAEAPLADEGADAGAPPVESFAASDREDAHFGDVSCPPP